VEPVVAGLVALFRFEEDWSVMAEHKALAVLNERLHTEAAMRAYQDCYLGLAVLYVLLLIPVWLLHRRYTVPGLALPAAAKTPRRG
jgi:hypothetical protein